MRRLAFRLLLCLMLVLNGTGYAVAATQMELAQVATALAVHEVESMPPCHEMAAPEAAPHMAQAIDQAGSDVPPCCQSSKCSCDYCLQHLTAAISVIAVPAAAPSGADIAQPSVVHRVAPPLPNLLRPPIC